MQWKHLCPLSRYPISTWEGYNSFLVYGLRWCKLWVSFLCNPWGPSASLLMVWNLLAPLVRQSECASPNTALIEVCPQAQIVQESHFVCVSCGLPRTQFPPLHAGSAWHAARTSGLWCSMTSANTAQGGDGLKPPEQLWLLGWSESFFRRSAPWHAWSQLVGRVSQKLASSKCSKSKRIWFYSLYNPIISACNVKDSVIQQFYFFPVPLLQMEHPNKV